MKKPSVRSKQFYQCRQLLTQYCVCVTSVQTCKKQAPLFSPRRHPATPYT